jgi:hypothetical protein
MMAEPTVLLASHPTRASMSVPSGGVGGDEAGSAQRTRRRPRVGRPRRLIGSSDTLLVMYGGRVVATLDPATVTPAELART